MRLDGDVQMSRFEINNTYSSVAVVRSSTVRYRYSFNPAVRAPPSPMALRGAEGKHLRLKVGDRHLRHHSLIHSIYTLYDTIRHYRRLKPAVGFILPVIRAAVSTNPASSSTDIKAAVVTFTCIIPHLHHNQVPHP